MIGSHQDAADGTRGPNGTSASSSDTSNGTSVIGAGKGYVGRFAPSPTGPLHAGSLVAALASYLDARAHDGRWLLRIEDIDKARTVPGASDAILRLLDACGMQSDGEILWQSQRDDAYEAAFKQLRTHVYPCGCSRREIADSQVGGNAASEAGLVYPGTCRAGLAAGRTARAWRLRVPAAGDAEEMIRFHDRACGWQAQRLASEAGDFVLRRADGFWAYQLAVVVDDAAQGVTHVVRGMDLLDSTPRQIYLQRLLAAPTPQYLHAPLVRNPLGEKLSKQTGATALDPDDPLPALINAAAVLGIPVLEAGSVADFWMQAVPLWRRAWASGS